MRSGTQILFGYLVLLIAVPLWTQALVPDENSEATRRDLPIQSGTLSLQYQGFEVREKSVQPSGGVRRGELPDYETIVAKFWGSDFDFESGDQDGDSELTEEELLNLLLKQSLTNEESIAWTTLIFRGGDVNKNNRISQAELMVLHYAPLLEHQIKEGYLSDGSTHVQISFEDDTLTEFVNTFAYFVATLRVEGYPAIETDILALDRKIDIDPHYFDHTLLPNLKNKAAFDLTDQTIKSEGRVVAMGINLCLFELNCIVRISRFDGDDNLVLSKSEWEAAKDTVFPENENLLSMVRGENTFGLENNDRTPTFETLDTNSNQSVSVAEIMQFLRDSIADFGDLKL